MYTYLAFVLTYNKRLPQAIYSSGKCRKQLFGAMAEVSFKFVTFLKIVSFN